MPLRSILDIDTEPSRKLLVTGILELAHPPFISMHCQVREQLM